MADESRTRPGPEQELDDLRRRISELEDLESEHRRAGEALRESEAKYRDLVENLNDVVYAVDRNGVVTYVSPSVERFIGYTTCEVIGQPFRTFVFEGDLPRLQGAFARLLAGDAAADEYRAVHRSGDVRWMRTSSQPMRSGDRVTGVHGVLADITEQKQAEEDLRDSEQRFRELAEMFPEIIFETNLKGDLTFVSKRAYQVFGYSIQDFERGINALDIIALPDREKAAQNIRRALSGEDTGAHEYTALARDGRAFPILIHSSPILGRAGPRGLRGVALDITERKRSEEALQKAKDELESRVEQRTAELQRANSALLHEIEERKDAEHALRQSEARLRALLDAPTDKVVLVDADGTIADINSNTAEAIGVEREKAIGTCIFDYFPQEAAQRRKSYHDLVVRMRRPTRFEDERNGIWHDTVVWPILDIEGDVTGVAVIARDVTERKLAEQALKESQAGGEGS